MHVQFLVTPVELTLGAPIIMIFRKTKILTTVKNVETVAILHDTRLNPSYHVKTERKTFIILPNVVQIPEIEKKSFENDNKAYRPLRDLGRVVFNVNQSSPLFLKN